MTSKFYFAEDGNYGSATNIVITDASLWTDEMFNLVDEAGHSYRFELAKHFQGEPHSMALDGDEMRCEVCTLTVEDLEFKD